MPTRRLSGYIRVVGLAPVTTLLAFGLAGMNTSRGLPEPWATFLAEPPDERIPEHQHRRYRPKRGSPPATPGGYTTQKRHKTSTPTTDTTIGTLRARSTCREADEPRSSAYSLM